MGRYCLLTWNGAGNQYPLASVAGELGRRGHEVVVAGYSTQVERFERLGLPFRVLERTDAALERRRGDGLDLAGLGEFIWASRYQPDDVGDLAGEAFDGFVVDCLLFGALTFLEARRVPTFVLVHSAPGALAPPGGFLDGLLLGRLNDLRADRGLPAVTTLWEAWDAFPTLCGTLPELDHLAGSAPASFRYVGPVLDPAPDTTRTRSAATDGLVAVVSFSTGPGWDQRTRIARTLEAVQGMPDFHALVTTGVTDVSGLDVPDNAELVPWVPHDEVLGRAEVVVTHAGHGTVCAALAHGVPIVAIPNPAADQPALAARVEALGAGLRLDDEEASPERVAAAIRTVTGKPAYREAARGLADRIAALPGRSRFADAVTGQP